MIRSSKRPSRRIACSALSNRARKQRRILALLDSIPDRTCGEWRCVVLSGTAPRQILKAAEDFDAQLIVMPTRGLSHAPPTEVGSTAERVVRHAPCPVLVLPKQMPRKGQRS